MPRIIQKFENWAETVFELDRYRTSVKRESAAGITIFLTMSYILFVQPSVLGAAGMDKGAVFTSTCIVSAIACLMMGFVAKLPVAQAPLMGENFFFAYTVVLGMGYSWRQGLSLVFISGILFLLLNFTKIRQRLISVIPDSLKFGISAGIGLFIAMIGFKQCGLIVADPATLLKLGPLHRPEILIAVFGFFITAAFYARKVRGSILWGMLATAGMLWLGGYLHYNGVFSMPPSVMPIMFKFSFAGLLTWHAVSVVIILLFMMIFDTMGTLIGLGVQAGLMEKGGNLKNIPRALLTDATATTIGAVMGNSTVSSYIESSTGIALGGKTGLTAIMVGLCFLMALFFSPLMGMFGGTIKITDTLAIQPVTSPALIMVGALMMGSAKNIKWDDFAESVPSFLTIALIPFTYNIADGISVGFISYPVLKAAKGESGEVSLLAWALAVVFLLRFIFIY